MEAGWRQMQTCQHPARQPNAEEEAERSSASWGIPGIAEPPALPRCLSQHAARQRAGPLFPVFLQENSVLLKDLQTYSLFSSLIKTLNGV